VPPSVQQQRRSIVLTHRSETYALLQTDDGRVFFRDSHREVQWDFVDCAAFCEWLETVRCSSLSCSQPP
jgi:hypothetical protein